MKPAKAARGARQDGEHEVGRCEFVKLSGPSGSGKTAFLELIAGLDGPDEGEVVMVETDVAVCQLTERQDTVSSKSVSFFSGV